MHHHGLYDRQGRMTGGSWDTFKDAVLGVVVVALVLLAMGLAGRCDYEDRVSSLSPAALEEASCETSR